MTTNQKTALQIDSLKINGIIIDPGNILSLDIYESLDFPGITGNLKFKDFGMMMEGYDIFAGDPVEIKMTSPGANTALEPKNLVVTESKGNLILEDSPATGVSLGFASEWVVNGMTMNISKAYKNQRIDEIIKDLIVTSGQPMGNNSSGGRFIKTKQTLENFVTPFWAPLKSIRYLMSMATDIGGFGGYVLFTEIDTGNVNFFPIGQILTGNYRTTDMTLRQNTHFDMAKNRVFNQSIENGFDVIKYGSQGLATSQYIGFDYDNSEEINIDKKIVDYYEIASDADSTSTNIRKEGYITEGKTVEGIKVKHLGKDTSGGIFPLNQVYLKDKYKNTKFNTFYNNTNELIKTDNKSLIEGRLNTKFSLMSADAIKINATTMGETEYKKVGTIINLMVPTPDQGKTRESEQLSGKYLITKIRHNYSQGQYTNTITLVSDSIKSMSTNRQDIIFWNGNNISKTDRIGTVEEESPPFVIDRRRRVGQG